MKYAVIIKHPYRDEDYRVDVVDVNDNTSPQDIKTAIERGMIGPFEVISVTPKISTRDISDSLESLLKETDSHIK